jgi:hypothetical protein
MPIIIREDGRIDERVAPEHVREARVVLEQLAHVVVLDEGEAARRDGAERVVHRPQVQTLEVGDVPGGVEGEDLALALVGELVAAGEALDHEAALRGPVAFADHVEIGPHVLDAHGQGRQRVALGGRQIGDAFELFDERMGGGG